MPEDGVPALGLCDILCTLDHDSRAVIYLALGSQGRISLRSTCVRARDFIDSQRTKPLQLSFSSCTTDVADTRVAVGYVRRTQICALELELFELAMYW